jgi:S-DNA-T family DNA segregation ATPase FtsK/SpoIIIE
MPQYTEISFEVSTKTDIESILKDKDDLLSYLKLEKFNISFKGNIVKFEIPNKVISKISVRQIFDSLKTVNNDEAIAGIGFDNVPLIVNFTKSPNVLIIGRRGSGAAMLLTILLTTLAYINTPNELEYNLLSPLGDKSLKYLDDLPQMQSSLISDPEECIGKLHQILDVIKERENKFKEVGAKTLDEYNKFQESPSTKLKTIVLAISSFDSLIKNSLQNLEIMSNILERGRNVGIKTILLAINVNNESAEKQIYEQIDARFILRLESERESLKIFDNYRGIQLLGNGDGYYFNDTKKLRFQTCYLNANELIETVKIIKTFYNSKEESN